MEAKKRREPSPPREPLPKRPLTAAAIAEQKGRSAIMPPATMKKERFQIKKPQIKPEFQVAHDQMMKEEAEDERRQAEKAGLVKPMKIVPSEEQMKAMSSRRSFNPSAQAKKSVHGLE